VPFLPDPFWRIREDREKCVKAAVQLFLMSAVFAGMGIYAAVAWKWLAALVTATVAIIESWMAVQLLRGRCARNSAWLLFAIMVVATFILKTNHV
jgi:uncharacterized membrane protein YphA (DoxX/SURF4 family)